MSSFPSIRIEGGLLGPELLDQVIAADVPGQKPADSGLEPKRNLTDEIATVFADSRVLATEETDQTRVHSAVRRGIFVELKRPKNKSPVQGRHLRETDNAPHCVRIQQSRPQQSTNPPIQRRLVAPSRRVEASAKTEAQRRRIQPPTPSNPSTFPPPNQPSTNPIIQ